nr:transcription factor FER-LIKE IRON DEFICIENCY-INDUCED TRANSCRIPTION FACTOR-like [Coffea arabica]
MEGTADILGLGMGNINDFGFIDFMDVTNFEQFIELVRGETAEPAVEFCADFDCDHIAGCIGGESQFVQPPEDQLFDFNITSLSEFNLVPEQTKVAEEENDGEEESSATATTPTNRSKKTDRSRTLVSERKRRGRMKEKLYALRSVVPNITKMDKASIIGDAVLYVQELQMQAKKLKAEIAGLESSLSQPNNYPGESFLNAKKPNFTINLPLIKKIFQMEVFPVEEREFYVRMACNKGQGIATLLYKALESLAGFIVHSSNLAAAAETYIFTFTLNVNEFEVEIHLPNLKLWIASAFLNQGFDFVTLPSS